MWPVLFGSGWFWGILVAFALMCVVIGFLGFLLLVIRPPEETAGPADQLWRRYEEGDITRAEFERLRRQAQ